MVKPYLGEPQTILTAVASPRLRPIPRIMPAKIPHEVKAGDKGLYLFAKFMPALC